MIDLGTAPRQSGHGNYEPNQGSAEAMIEQLKAKMQGVGSKGMIDLSLAPQQRAERYRPEAAPSDPVEAFRATLANHGFMVDHIDTSGSLVRVDIDKPGDKAGWYVFHFGEVSAGAFGNWRTDLNEKWCSKDRREMSDAESAEYRRFNERAKAQREAQRLADQEQSATKAKAILTGAIGDPAGHAYATNKNVSFGSLVKRGPWAQRSWSDALLVPMFDESGHIVSVQAINANGTKDFIAGGKKKGCFHPLGEFRGTTGRALIGEGLATVAAVVSATELPGVVAFDASNLLHVAGVVRRLAPEAEIVLLADDDCKEGTDKNAGVEAATRAAMAVGGVLATPNMGKKADFWDVWAEQGPEAVRAALDKALEGSRQATTSHGNRKRFTLTRYSEIISSVPDWLIRGWLERDVLAILFGDPAAGKTFFAIPMACCLVTGTPFYGHAVKIAPVVFIVGEGNKGFKRRVDAWSIRHNITLGNAPLFISAMPAALLDSGSVAEVFFAIDEVATEHGAPGLIIIDTVARNFGPGDENSTQDMGRFIQAADAIRMKYKAAVLVVHHTGHADKTRPRGSLALTGAADFEYRLSKGDDDVIRCDCTKCKDHEKPEPMAFRLRSVELPLTDEEGRPVTSAVLDLTSYEPPPKPGKVGRGKHQSRAKEILDNLHQRHRENLEKDGRDPAGARVTVDEWSEACRHDGLERNRFREVRSSLESHGVVVIESGFVRFSKT